MASRAGLTVGAAPAGRERRPSAARSPRRAASVTCSSCVASGATNRQIAAALYISDKTASVHVSRILAKLGVTSRQEAATLARRRRR